MGLFIGGTGAVGLPFAATAGVRAAAEVPLVAGAAGGGGGGGARAAVVGASSLRYAEGVQPWTPVEMSFVSHQPKQMRLVR